MAAPAHRGLVISSFVYCLSSLRSASAASVCNGGNFCDLPLMRYTFPGTHNSGSHDPLDGPSDAGGAIVQKAALCYYRNHLKDYKEQLDSGIRFFNIDLCDQDGEAGYYNCHAPELNDGMTAFGSEFAESLDVIKAWALDHRSDVIVLQPSDFQFDSVANNRVSWNNEWRYMMENDPFACVQFSWSLEAKTGDNEIGCVLLENDMPPETLTLGWLVDKGYTIIAAPVYDSSLLVDTWTEGYGGMTVEELFQHHEQVAKDPKSWGEIVYEFSIFRSPKVPDLSVLNSCTFWDCITGTISAIQEMQLSCNSWLGKTTNEYFFPAEDRTDEDGGRYYISESAGCDGSCCEGYRSEFEILHSKMLDKNSSIWTVLADFTNYGDLVGTVQRMNEMTVRRQNGEREPGRSWISCNTGAFVAIVVCSCLFVIFLTLAILIWTGLCRKCWRRHCCCKEFCCPKRRGHRRKRDKLGDMENQQLAMGGAGMGGNGMGNGGVMYVNKAQPAQMNMVMMQQQQVPVATGGVYYQQNMQVQGGQALAPQSAYGMSQAQPQMVGMSVAPAPAGASTFPARWQTE
mmetsp:Transcript_7344/g.16222  ORF Transcript_7344/g.16222 Transcript_7344/m.16222 type:complete len:570 (+) Transcript_7344:224-1933(+)